MEGAKCLKYDFDLGLLLSIVNHYIFKAPKLNQTSIWPPSLTYLLSTQYSICKMTVAMDLRKKLVEESPQGELGPFRNETVILHGLGHSGRDEVVRCRRRGGHSV